MTINEDKYAINNISEWKGGELRDTWGYVHGVQLSAIPRHLAMAGLHVGIVKAHQKVKERLQIDAEKKTATTHMEITIKTEAYDEKSGIR